MRITTPLQAAGPRKSFFAAAAASAPRSSALERERAIAESSQTLLLISKIAIMRVGLGEREATTHLARAPLRSPPPPPLKLLVRQSDAGRYE